MKLSEKQIRLRLGGMTCVHCQSKIEKALRRTDGILSASVSFTTGAADITYDADKLSLGNIKGIITELGYHALPEQGGDRPDFGRVTGTLVIILCLYGLLEKLGILNYLVPSQLADTGMGYGMLFLTGLATSVHCVAMCGGINLSQSLPRNSETGGSTGAAFLPSLLYNLGRVISYTAIGFVLGAVGFLIGGGQVGLSTLLQGVLKLIAGTFMVIMGINMLGLFPRLRALTPRMPKFLTEKLGARRAKATGPLVVGLLNGLMPCGPLQSMQIVALASGNPVTGALSMLLFSLGTVPLMLGLGSLVAALGKKFAKAVNFIGAILVAVLGLAMLSQGVSLSGLLSPDILFWLIAALFAFGLATRIPSPGKAFCFAGITAVICAAAVFLTFQNRGATPSAGASANAAPAAEVQIVNSTLSPGRYPSITVQAGTPVKWIIDAPKGSINGCNYQMIIPAYGITHTFQEGENIIEFTPTDTGTFQYTCWMGMIRGSILVTDGSPSETPETAVYPANGFPSCCQ